MTEAEAERLRRLRARNLALLGVIGALVALFFVMTLVKLDRYGAAIEAERQQAQPIAPPAATATGTASPQPSPSP